MNMKLYRTSGLISPGNRRTGQSELMDTDSPEQASRENGIGGKFPHKGPRRCQAGGQSEEA